MRFGSREIVDVVFRAKSKLTLGSRTFYKNDPVLYFETLKTSSLEGASSTVYAQGGRGNARLIAWDGDRTLTLNMEDALLTPESFAILAGASLTAASSGNIMYVHTTSQVEVKEANKITLSGIKASQKAGAEIYCITLSESGEVETEPCRPTKVEISGEDTVITCEAAKNVGDIVLVDYYVEKTAGAVQIEITPDILSTYFYIEGSTLYRRESDGVDMPAEIVIPKGKVQSNFTVSMASTGDPSTFNFVVDTFPDYTKFDKTKKVQAIIQIVSDVSGDGEDDKLREPCAVVGG